MISRNIIEELAAEELVDANTKHDPKFNSPHEAYAVLKEEVEEMEVEVDLCKDRLHMLWDCVKNDDDQNAEHNLNYIRAYATKAAQEAIQVVAMCDKASKLY